jgi:hypothetical protein
MLRVLWMMGCESTLRALSARGVEQAARHEGAAEAVARGFGGQVLIWQRDRFIMDKERLADAIVAEDPTLSRRSLASFHRGTAAPAAARPPVARVSGSTKCPARSC